MASGQQHRNMPEEMVIETLSRLPPESLLRFRCVSKLWRSLISNHKFTLSSPSQRHLHVANHTNGEFFYSFNDQQHTWSSDTLPLKANKIKVSHHYYKILGSCNGLLLVIYFADLYLWNPTIRQCAKVLSVKNDSSPNLLSICTCRTPQSGLCYDSYSDDYKAVMVDFDGSITVISCRRRKWDKIICSSVAVEQYSERVNSGPVVNEKLHWLITEHANPTISFPTLTRIVYFDPLTDEFEGLPMPPVPNKGKHIIIGLGVLEGCLCMARYVCEGGDEVEPSSIGDEHDFTFEAKLAKLKPLYIEVLVMEEHGVVESWTRGFIISKDFGILPWPHYGCLVPLCFKKDGEVLIRVISVHGYQLLAYNPDEMSKRDIPLPSSEHCHYLASYVESLASPTAYGHEENWIVPDAWNFFFCPFGGYTDSEDNSTEEEDTSYGYCSDKESFRSTKEGSSIEEEDTSYGYCSDKESFRSTKEGNSIEEEDTSYGYCSDNESCHLTKEDSSFEEEDTPYGYCSDKESYHSTKEGSSIEEEDTSYGYCSANESFHSTEEDSSS